MLPQGQAAVMPPAPGPSARNPPPPLVLQSGLWGLLLVPRWMQWKQNWWQHGMVYATLSQFSRHMGQWVPKAASTLPPVAVGMEEWEMTIRSPTLMQWQQVSHWNRTRDSTGLGQRGEGSSRSIPPAASVRHCHAAYLPCCTRLCAMSRLPAPSRVRVQHKWL